MNMMVTGDLQGAAFADFTGGDFSGKKYYKANFKGDILSFFSIDKP